MGTLPKISVIIPVYNSEKFLTSTLNSVFNQTLSELEIICVNDCSTDGSLALLNKLASEDQRIVICNNTENSGVALSRNRGIEKATGEYITFLDNDDTIEPNMYETLYQEAIQGNYDVVKCDVFIHSGDQVYSPVYELDFKGKELRDRLIALLLYQFKEDNLPKGLWISGVWNKLYKRELLCNNQLLFLSEREFSNEDFLFNLFVLLKTDKIQNIKQPLYHYNYHPDSLGGSYIYQRYFNRVKTLELAEKKIMEDSTLEPDIINRLYYRTCTNIPIGINNELKRHPHGIKGALKEIGFIFMHPFTRKAISKVKLRRIIVASDSRVYKLFAKTIFISLKIIYSFTTGKQGRMQTSNID